LSFPNFLDDAGNLVDAFEMEKKAVAPPLELKTCICGCRRTWQATASSKSLYFSNEECKDFEALQKEFRFGDVRRSGAFSKLLVG